MARAGLRWHHHDESSSKIDLRIFLARLVEPAADGGFVAPGRQEGRGFARPHPHGWNGEAPVADRSPRQASYFQARLVERGAVVGLVHRIIRHIVGLERTGLIAGPVGPASHETGIHAQREASEKLSFNTGNDAALLGQNSCFREVAGMGTSKWGVGRE